MHSALAVLEPWLLDQRGPLPIGHADYALQSDTFLMQKRALMNTLLTVEPHDYIYDDFTMTAATKKLLWRVLDFNNLIQETFAHFPMLPLPANDTTDLFGSDVPDKIWAVTASGPKNMYVGDANDWSYNCILNGNLHPATREPILYFQYFNLNAFSSLSCIFKLSRTEVKKIKNELNQENDSPKNSALDSIELFEDFFNMPEDRRYSSIHPQVQRENEMFFFLAQYVEAEDDAIEVNENEIFINN
jgi:hypothetical protein